MAEKFTGVVIVRCNCEHAISGAPIAVTVAGSSGDEYAAAGVTNAFGFFLLGYARGSRPIDVTTVAGKVQACGQSIEFGSMDIKMGVDWEAVIQRINATRKLPRDFALDDLKEQVEYFSFTSLDIVKFSSVIEVSIFCHDDCVHSADDLEHGGAVADPGPSVPVDYRIALACPGDEKLAGMLYGLGTGPTPGDAEAEARARARQLAEDKVRQIRSHYRCKDGCTLSATEGYSVPQASPGVEYDDTVPADAFMSLAVIDWRLKLVCA